MDSTSSGPIKRTKPELKNGAETPSRPPLLLDEIEENMRTYEQKRIIQVGLKLDSMNFHQISQTLASECYQIACCSSEDSNATFMKLLVDKQEISESEVQQNSLALWKKQMFGVKNGFVAPPDLNRAVLAFENYVIGSFSKIDPKHPDFSNNNRLLWDRAADLLTLQLKHFSSLKIWSMVFEVPLLSPDVTSLILNLFYSGQIEYIQPRKDGKTFLILVKMNFGPASSGDLEWFKDLRKRAFYNTQNIRPALKLEGKLPSDQDVAGWLSQGVAYIFISTDLFEIRESLDGSKEKVPFLSRRCRRIILSFIERGSRIIIEPKKGCLKLQIYSEYIWFFWSNYLKDLLQLS